MTNENLRACPRDPRSNPFSRMHYHLTPLHTACPHPMHSSSPSHPDRGWLWLYWAAGSTAKSTSASGRGTMVKVPQDDVSMVEMAGLQCGSEPFHTRHASRDTRSSRTCVRRLRADKPLGGVGLGMLGGTPQCAAWGRAEATGYGGIVVG